MKKYINRLLSEWITHGKIIIAVDYDDTISPWGFKSDEDLKYLDKTIQILKKAKETGAYLSIFSACDENRYEEIEKYCESKGLKIDSINKNPIEGLLYGHNGKIFANIFIDDRAGLNEALFILETAMYKYIGYKKSLEHLDDAA
jgi:hypothetical protein